MPARGAHLFLHVAAWPAYLVLVKVSVPSLWTAGLLTSVRSKSMCRLGRGWSFADWERVLRRASKDRSQTLVR
jgi:hypothetical protein